LAIRASIFPSKSAGIFETMSDSFSERSVSRVFFDWLDAMYLKTRAPATMKRTRKKTTWNLIELRSFEIAFIPAPPKA